MTKQERYNEVVENLKHTIAMGGNPINVAKLKEILANVENGTHVVKKRPGRKPSRKNEK
ncbi:MAG: hypothetical protein P8N56_00975 [Schleiferiaceae bacterium]|nr:hypothetical protein [Schleiferiaceae bacterium]